MKSAMHGNSLFAYWSLRDAGELQPKEMLVLEALERFGPLTQERNAVGRLNTANIKRRHALAGQRFGYLVAREYCGDCKWLCVCDCGGEKLVTGSALVSWNTKSCGCKKGAMCRKTSTRHEMSGSRIWECWAKMRQRCSNQFDKGFKNYGGRGITVCERWQVFENFVADMGPMPDGLTIERIDVNGNYEPANCRWATKKEQSRNKRTNRFLELNGEKRCLTDWAQMLGIRHQALADSIDKKGWPLERALDPASWKDLPISRRTLNAEQARVVRDMYQPGVVGYISIVQHFAKQGVKVSVSTVRAIANGRMEYQA